MDILILIGQRKCAYEGQYAPEILAAIDDIGDGDNPDYMCMEKRAAVASREFDALTIVKVRVSGAAVTEALYPAQKAIEGVVISTEAP